MIGYFRAPKRINKLEQCSVKCMLFGWDPNHLRDAFTVLNLMTREMFVRQDVTWQSEMQEALHLDERAKSKQKHPRLTDTEK